MYAFLKNILKMLLGFSSVRIPIWIETLKGFNHFELSIWLKKRFYHALQIEKIV